ncbi:MAG: GNAT family N-acetyltransferase [Chitinophagales bacterium]|nr:GNAT family N-acetyltransferase [Chitinophagaceae bacterium]MCB9064089.1 GNAT family N-acetyltransferase [Chitinophagales bacterium]
MKVITVHGIRSRARWDETFKELKVFKENNVEVVNFNYGYLTMVGFILKVRRNKVIKKFQKFYSDNFNPTDPPSIVCHSFGTYIFYSTLRKYEVIKFNKVILCGSILKHDLDWGAYFENGQIKAIYNDYGIQDKVVKYSKVVLKDGGNSGQIGFAEPSRQPSCLTQVKNNYHDHSSYFLEIHMREKWAKWLLQPRIANRTFKYNKKILRPEIIDRIYQNFEEDNNIRFQSVVYKGRVDTKGNYYAHYKISGVVQDNISQYLITTTADSTNENDEMDFQAYDDSGKKLNVDVRADDLQHKTFIIHLDKTLVKGEIIGLSYKFLWKNTMSVRRGDTDHYNIKGASKVIVSLNSSVPLPSAKFFIIGTMQVVEVFNPIVTKELDGSCTYSLEYDNIHGHDGIVFYFEGSVSINVTHTPTLSRSDKMQIVKCSKEDIRKIYRIESDIEYSNAASEETLFERLQVFNDGFYVAKEKNQVLGYIESIIWDDWDFESFSQIKNFPLHFNPGGDTMYIIFLAVAETFRGKKLGYEMMSKLFETARRYDVKQIKLVAKDNLTLYYERLGFKIVKELPSFLPNNKCKSTLMTKTLDS